MIDIICEILFYLNLCELILLIIFSFSLIIKKRWRYLARWFSLTFGIMSLTFSLWFSIWGRDGLGPDMVTSIGLIAIQRMMEGNIDLLLMGISLFLLGLFIFIFGKKASTAHNKA